jgi:hypothetical protein
MFQIKTEYQPEDETHRKGRFKISLLLAHNGYHIAGTDIEWNEDDPRDVSRETARQQAMCYIAGAKDMLMAVRNHNHLDIEYGMVTRSLPEQTDAITAG